MTLAIPRSQLIQGLSARYRKPDYRFAGLEGHECL